jgi:hypothetical protein
VALEMLIEDPLYKVNVPGLVIASDQEQTRHVLVLWDIAFMFDQELFDSNDYSLVMNKSRLDLTEKLEAHLDKMYGYIDRVRDVESASPMEIFQQKVRAFPLALKELKTVRGYFRSFVDSGTKEVEFATAVQETLEKGEEMLVQKFSDKEFLSNMHVLACLHRRYAQTLEKVRDRNLDIFNILYPR